MAQLNWLPEALDDIERLNAFLRDKDSDVAARSIVAILQKTEMLKKSPKIGRLLSDDSGRRELIVHFGSGAYILRYMIENEVVFIIRVWHSREDRY